MGLKNDMPMIGKVYECKKKKEQKGVNQKSADLAVIQDIPVN